MTVFPDGDYGKIAILQNLKVIERLGYVTLIECELETELTRLEFIKHIGHTLFNDMRYGGNIILKEPHILNTNNLLIIAFIIELTLLLKTLGFNHPKSKKMVRI